MQTRKIKILAIDDNPDNLISINVLINDIFPDSITYTSLSGELGLKLAAHENPDVILLDVLMPGMDGFEVCRILKADANLRDIPVIFIADIKDQKENRIRALESGAEGILSKPIDKSELVAQIKSMVKIRNAKNEKRKEKEHLEALVEIRTQELKIAHKSTLDLLKDLKKENAARIKSEERYRTIIENIGEGIGFVNSEEEFVYVNSAAEEIFGVEPGGLVGMNLNQFLSAEQYKSIQQETSKRIQGNKSVYELEIFRPNGEKRFIIVTAVPHDDKETGFIGTYGVFRDITERKTFEDALIESERLLRESQVVARLGSYVWNIPTGLWKSSKILDEIFGIDEHYLRSFEGWVNIVHPEWQQIMSDHVANDVLGKNQRFDKEYKITRQNDGSELWVHGLGVLEFDINLNPLRLIGTIQDITKRKKAELLLLEKNEALIKANEELVKAKGKAEESDRLKSAFLTNMSHEIRTPMNGILGFTSLLKKPDLSGDEQQNFIRIIEKSGARMLNIINDIIDISKIESGQFEVFISRVNINEQVEFLHSFFKPEAEQKGIRISFKNYLPADEAVIKTDKEKVFAILTNLIKNAIKFTNKGSIEFGYVIKHDCEPVGLEFFVKDTGIGIPHEKKELIFERFRQGSESLTRNYEGAGLGLSISKGYVEMLGGKIWVESEEGKGSVFYFTIPSHAEADKKLEFINAELHNKESNPLRNLKILIAEDDEASEMLLELAIEAFQKEVIKVRTGVDAVEMCRNNPDIDLVLMDIKMPKMDGYEATRQIRAFNKDVIIFAQTAFAHSDEKIKAIESGCNDYIAKPFNKDMLTMLVKKYF